MGVIFCEEHGSNWLEHVCEHLRAAVLTGSRLPEYFEYPLGTSEPPPDDVWAVFCLCRECAEPRRLPIPARTISEAEQDGEYREIFEIQAVCSKCFVQRSSATRPPENP